MNYFRTLLCTIFLCVISTIPCFAHFTVVDAVHLSKDYSTHAFQEAGKTVRFSYIGDTDTSSHIVITRSKAKDFTISVPAWREYGRTDIAQIVDEQGHTFYIVQLPHTSGLGYHKGYNYAYVFGFDEQSERWNKYIDFDSFYLPSQRGDAGIAISQGKLMIYNGGYTKKISYQPNYQLTEFEWNDKNRWLVVSQRLEGSLDSSNTIALQNPHYRPLGGAHGFDAYVDLQSMETLQDDVYTWIFEVKTLYTNFGSGILYAPHNATRFMINKQSKQLWIYREYSGKWEEINTDKSPSVAMSGAVYAANWCYYQRYGEFLGDFGGGMDSLIRMYEHYQEKNRK